MTVKRMAITTKATNHASMEAFNDPEIRSCIMENSDPSTLFAVASASPEALRSFKQYPRTFLLASIDTLHPLETLQAGRLVKAMLTRQDEDRFKREFEDWYNDPEDHEKGNNIGYESSLFRGLDCRDPWPKSITESVSLLKRLAKVQDAVDILEVAPIWLCFRGDPFSGVGESGSNPLRNGQLRHILWLFELYCEIYDERYHNGGIPERTRHNTGPYAFRYIHRELSSASLLEMENFVNVYINIFDMLEGVYEEDMAYDFEKSYQANIGDADWVALAASEPLQLRVGRENVRRWTMEETTRKIGHKMSLGTPFLAQMYQNGASSKFKDYPKLMWFFDNYRCRAPSDWSCRTYEAFELKPWSKGERVGYRLSMVFKNGAENPLRQVDYDALIFTNGYHPPDLGTGSIARAQRDWQYKILREDLMMLHRGSFSR